MAANGFRSWKGCETGGKYAAQQRQKEWRAGEIGLLPEVSGVDKAVNRVRATLLH